MEMQISNKRHNQSDLKKTILKLKITTSKRYWNLFKELHYFKKIIIIQSITPLIFFNDCYTLSFDTIHNFLFDYHL